MPISGGLFSRGQAFPDARFKTTITLPAKGSAVDTTTRGECLTPTVPPKNSDVPRQYARLLVRPPTVSDLKTETATPNHQGGR
jgi:hypothetical protein